MANNYRRALMKRARQASAPAIPAWRELMRLDEAEAVAMAAAHGIDVATRSAALSALNDKRKAGNE